MRTALSIIENFNERVTNQDIIPSDQWMQAAQFLNVLIGTEQYKLAETEQAYTQVALNNMENGDTNALAEKKAKVSPEFIQFKRQQAFVKQIEEFIRLAKKQATITHEQGS